MMRILRSGAGHGLKKAHELAFADLCEVENGRLCAEVTLITLFCAISAFHHISLRVEC